MKTKTKLLLAISASMLTIFAGSYLFSVIEKWSYTDSIYFTALTLLTIGYGDLYPMTDAGKIFTVIFAFIGIGILLFTFASLAEWFVLRKKRK